MDKPTKVIPIFIPHEGCPHDCVFCNQKKISGSINSPSIDDIKNIIEAALKTLDSSKYQIILAFYGGSFTAIDQMKQREYLEIAKLYKDNHKIQSIRLSTRPDYMKIEHVKLLKEYGVDHVELGIQSTHDEVLELSKRHYNLDIIQNAASNLKEYQLDFGFQIMLGLPGDKLDNLIKTCFDLLPLYPSTLRIYPTLVIVDTELAQMYYSKEYAPLSLNEAVEQSIIPMIIFESIGCAIIRVGLHAAESLISGDNIVAGPFHSAFGEMVQSRIYWYMLKDAIETYELQKKSIIICANPRDFSKITGNKGENRRLLKENFDVEYKFQEDHFLKDDIIIIYGEYRYTLKKEDFYSKQLEDYKQLLRKC